MQMTPARRKPGQGTRATTAVAFAGVVLSLTAVFTFGLLLAKSGGSAGTTADWLINYAGGPIRRGLIGAALMMVTQTSASLLLATLLVQVAALGVIGWASLTLFLGTSRSPAWLMLLLSPAFTLFPVLNLHGGMRKEILALAALALLAIRVRYNRFGLLLWMTPVVFAIAAFSHELTVLMLPPFLYLLWRGVRDESLSRTAGQVVGGILLTTALSAAVFSVVAPGTVAQATSICASWASSGISDRLCFGSLSHIGESPADAMALVSTVAPSATTYLLPLLLSLVPLIAIRPPRPYLALVGFTYLALAPLFIVGIDYGRWIYVATASLSLVALATSRAGHFRPVRVPGWGAAVFIVSWSVPYTFGTSSSLVQLALEASAAVRG